MSYPNLKEEKRYWVKPSECISFWHWMYFTWDFRKRWKGSSILIREIGIRIFGFEFTYDYKQKED